MGIYLNSKDLAALEIASRAMLSSGPAESMDKWRADLTSSLRRLFHADKTLFFLTSGHTQVFSDEAPQMAADLLAAAAVATAEGARKSRWVFGDESPVRDSTSGEVVIVDIERDLTGTPLRGFVDSQVEPTVLRAHGISWCGGLLVGPPDFRVGAFALFERSDSYRSVSRCESLLRLLLPSFRSGVETLIRRESQKRILDRLSDPVIVMDSDGRALYHNASFDRLLRIETDRHGLMREIGLASAASWVQRSAERSSCAETDVVVTVRRVATSNAQYDLSAERLPDGLFGAGRAIMVSVMRLGPPELPPVEALRARFGLTRREAEVALRLAEGSSNGEIAQALCLSPHTARRHTANVFDKLGVRSRKGMALRLLSH